MKAPELYRQVALFGKIADKHALSKQYRALALGPAGARACAPFGVMKAGIDLGLDREVHVDADDFIAVLNSLSDAEFTLENSDNALRWQCGPHQRGHLTCMTDALDVPDINYEDDVLDQAVPADFGEALELGALACGPGVMRTLGLYGVQLKNVNGRAYAFATDVTTLSACCLGNEIQIVDDGIITLKPEAAKILAALIKRDGQAFLGSNKSAVYCVTPQAELLLNQNAPLRHDIASIAKKFTKAEIKVPLFREAILAFLKRVAALADAALKAEVEVSVSGGQTRLTFAETTSSTEEYYLVQGGLDVTVAPVRLEAYRMAHALQYASDLVFDYASSQNLILRGPREFVFGISGRPEPAA